MGKQDFVLTDGGGDEDDVSPVLPELGEGLLGERQRDEVVEPHDPVGVLHLQVLDGHNLVDAGGVDKDVKS